MFVKIALVTFIGFVLAWSVLARVSEGAGAGERYRVRSGDTLWSIATTHYRGDPRQGVWQIQRRNRLDSAALVPGQTLLLP